MEINKTITTKKYSAGINTCTFIMLHHTASKATDINVVKYLAYNPAEVSCHYTIGRDGTIYQIASNDKITRHAGSGEYMGITAMNNHAIGIEVHSDGYEYTDKQRESTKRLIKKLMKEYNLPIHAIIRHKDYTKRKWDIGDDFWKNEFQTFEAYKKSFERKISILERKIAETAMRNNSKLWETTDDIELKDLLHKTNNAIRSEY